ncbi:MAG: sigma-E processing peptidase SpoIIGA [Butyrivibrio sp.]|nr:sigma-E processing peptidase SpoIIGA [Acetatifactor muris]MCM1561248.1 sigma-E processing peptidase SpoIIGA [Butyrivibrio sp.]
MRYELYVDSLFLVNFVMNLYILMLVDRSTFHTAAPRRLLLGAALGGGCYLLLFLLNVPVPWKLFLGAAGALGMLPVAFPVRGLRNFLKLMEKMLVFSFCLGGGLLFLLRSFPVGGGALTGIFGILGAGGIVCLFLGRFPWESKPENSICRVTLVRGEKQVTVSALIDSGNSLSEPVSGKPVCVVEEEVFRRLWEDGGQLFRAIPYHSIGKRKGILKGYLLPELQVELHGMRKAFYEIYIAVSPETISAADAPETDAVKMIMNPRILEAAKREKPEKGQIEPRKEKKKMEAGYDIKSGNTGKNEI